MSENPIDAVVSDEGALTLDKVLRTVPSTISDADLDGTIDHLRLQRAAFIKADQKKGKEDEPETRPTIEDNPPSD